MEKPQEIGDVMYTVCKARDVKNEQFVSLHRNGDEYTVFISNTSDGDFKSARAILDQKTAQKLYLKIARAFATEKYSWATRSGWVKKAGRKVAA
ncbi:MAG: hypothetical protein ACI4V3_05280 [Faecousia sp.]